MRAVRLPDGAMPKAPGEIAWQPKMYRPPYGERGEWFMCTPQGRVGALIPEKHTWTVEPDGSLTVTPSIVYFDYHGFLTRGEWSPGVQPPAGVDGMTLTTARALGRQMLAAHDDYMLAVGVTDSRTEKERAAGVEAFARFLTRGLDSPTVTDLRSHEPPRNSGEGTAVNGPMPLAGDRDASESDLS